MEVLAESGIGLSLESNRETAESAREKTLAAAEALQARIETAALTQRAVLDTVIKEASTSGQYSARHKYAESLDSSYSEDEVKFIKFFADATTGLVTESLRSDGFKVKTRAEEVFLDHDYYVTRFKVSWK